jgi:hypothetical protein
MGNSAQRKLAPEANYKPLVMKIGCILFVLFLMNPFCSYAQNGFIKNINGLGHCYTDDGNELKFCKGYITVGGTKEHGPASFKLHVARTDLQGNLLQTFYAGGDLYANAFYEMPDGFLVSIIMQYSDQGFDVNDVLYLKIDTLGNMLWNKKMAGLYDDFGTAQPYKDGILYSGNSKSFTGKTLDLFLTLTNSKGDTILNKVYDYGKSDMGYAHPLKNGGYYFTGTTNSFGNFYNTFISVMDSSGNQQWIKTYGTGGNTESAVIPTSANGFAIYGYATDTLGKLSSNFFIITNTIGDTLKSFNNSTNLFLPKSVCQINDSEYAITGSSYIQGTAKGYLYKINTLGDTLWKRTFPEATSVIWMKPTTDKGFIIGGESKDAQGLPIVVLIKTDSLGLVQNVNAIKETIALNELCIAYPNPFKENLYIQSNCIEGKVEISLFNLQGATVYKELFNATPGPSTLSICPDIPAGEYFLYIRCNSKSELIAVIKL